MSIAFQCERCGKGFKVGNELAGKRCKCKQCGHVFAIPNARPATGFAPSPSPRERDGEPAPQRSRSTRTKPSPPAFARDGDPYDTEDFWTKETPPNEPDLDELLPQRPKASVKRRRKSAKSGRQNLAGIPIWVFLVGAFFGFALARRIWLLNPPDLNSGWLVLAFVSYTLSMSGGLGCLVVAFREGPSYGLCCLFMPFYIFYYVFSRWESTQVGFALSFIGGMLISGASAIAPDIFDIRAERRIPKVAAAPANVVPFGRPSMAPPPWREGRGVPMLPHPVPGQPGMTVQPAAAPVPPRVILEDFTDQVLSDLNSHDRHLRSQALGRLKNAPPNDRRDAVAKAVEPLLADPDGFCRSDAAKVLAVWGGPENTPALLKGLKDPAFNVRWAILDALRDMRDPKAADALIDYLMTSNDRGKAADALKAIGSEAEDAVLRGINHHDGFARMDVCKILKAIGTAKSVPALQGLLRRTRGHGLDAMAAGEALEEIKSRNFR